MLRLALCHGHVRNPHLIYALLHKRQVFDRASHMLAHTPAACEAFPTTATASGEGKGGGGGDGEEAAALLLIHGVCELFGAHVEVGVCI